MKRFGNQCGAVEVAIVIAIAAATFLFGTITGGSKLNPLKWFQTGDAANKKASWTKWDEKMTPTLLTDKEGRPVAVGTEIRRVYDTGKEDVKPRASYGEQVAGFFAGLTNVGILVFFGLLIFCPSVLAAWGLKKYHQMRGVAKTVIAGVKDAPSDAAEEVKKSIAVKQDKSQKQIVAKLKGELQ